MLKTKEIEMSATRFDDRDIVYLDVDGTLILWSAQHPYKAFSAAPRVNVALAHEVRVWKSQRPHGDIDKRFLAMWSAGGQDHARWAAKEAEIDDLVDAYLPKPQAIIDDSYSWISRPDRVLWCKP